MDSRLLSKCVAALQGRGVGIVLRGCCIAALLIMLNGVAATAEDSKDEKIPTSSMPPLNEHVGDNHAAVKEVEAASRLVDAGDTSPVIPKLLSVISKYPETVAAHEARYWLGRAYYKLGGYRDALDLFKEYLKFEPEGRYVEDSNTYIKKITTEYGQKFLSADKLDENIQILTAELAKSPENIGTQLALADLLWRRGEYDKAAAMYKDLIGKHPDQTSNEIIRQRVDLTNGQFTALTPAEVARRQAEDQPLVVINTNSFQSGKDLFTRETRFYSVTGQVVNRSASAVNGVQVMITIYGLTNVVYDTTTVSIGRMNPSEIRPFSVRFSNLENIENVNRFECLPTFQR